MTPLIAKLLTAGAVAIGGFEAWKHFYPKLQSLRTMSASGHPIQVVVPVESKILPRPIRGQSEVPIPPINGNQVIHIPSPPAPIGRVNSEPTIITPTGASNLSVDNVSDIQTALNTLGQQPPLKVDGIDGPLTFSAIRSFQQSHGMSPDGQVNPQLRSTIQQALLRVAGTQSHIGQSLQVQAAPQNVAAAHAPVNNPNVGQVALNLANTALKTPAVQSLVNTGLSAVANLFQGGNADTSGEFGIGVIIPSQYPHNYSDDLDAGADDAPSSPTNPPPTVVMISKSDAIKALQHALNQLGASPPLDENGKYNDETVAAIKAAQITLGLAADGIPGPKTATAVAIALDPHAQQAIVPSVAKAADHIDSVAATAPPDQAPVLKKAAEDLKSVVATTPQPTETQTHASTAAAQAATASTTTPPDAKPALVDATHSLAAAATSPVPDAANLTNAAKALTVAATAAAGTPAAPSLAAAAEHVTSAVTAPDVATQGDHLNSAAMHLANAAVGTPSPTTASTSGEFGGIMNWFTNAIGSIFGHHGFRRWHHRMHPAYAPPVPSYPQAYGEFGYGRPMPPMGGGGYGGGYGRHDDWRRRQWQQQMMQQQGQGYGDSGGGNGDSDMGEFGVAPPIAYRGQPIVPGVRPAGLRPMAPTGGGYRPAPPVGQYGPAGQYGTGNQSYWQARAQGMEFDRDRLLGGMQYDRNWYQQYGQSSPDWWQRRRWQEDAMMAQQAALAAQQVPTLDPNAINPYVDPNAGNPSVQNPALDAQSNGGGSSDDDS